MNIMHPKICLGLLFGGKSKEHEVSLWSARNIAQALSPDRYTVVPLALTKTNRLVTVGGRDMEAIARGGRLVLDQQCILTKEEAEAVPLSVLGELPLDVILPVMHGDFGEDGRMQGFLDMLDIPYAGSGVLASAIGMDKVVQKQLCTGMEVPMVRWTWCSREEWDGDGDRVRNRIGEICGFPCFVKPANTGSSVGISRVTSVDELDHAMETALLYDHKVIVEQGLAKPREVEVALLETPEGMRAAQVMAEVNPAGEFYDFDAKYDPASLTKAVIPAPVSEELGKRLSHLALHVAKLHTVQGFARVDFFVDGEGEIYFNEVNTLPGFTANSAFGKMWEASGMTYGDLLDTMITVALHKKQQRDSLHYEA